MVNSVCIKTEENEKGSLDYPLITVLICTLNEETNLPYVLPKIPTWIHEILLVDGNSTDSTIEVAKTLRSDLRILTQPKKGKGDALKFGVAEAKGDIIVTLDADGETPPEEIERFIHPLLEGYSFAKGSRLHRRKPKKMPLYRWIGNKILAYTCNLLYGTRFSDVCSGYNSFWKKDFLNLDLSFGEKEVGCSMEQQLIVRAKKSGMKIKEVPINSNGRINGKSVIHSVKDSIKQGFKDWFLIIGERFNG
jgi:glycosyltransferase involved in cell wall biosynthesis